MKTENEDGESEIADISELGDENGGIENEDGDSQILNMSELAYNNSLY